MVLEQRQINLLIAYRDKSYIMNMLCEKSFERFNFIKSICNIPLIIISSCVAILNSSSINAEDMKLPNIVINSLTAMLISMIGNFKVNEKEQGFKQLSNKFMKLTHEIEDDLNNHLQELTGDDVSSKIKDYDCLIETIEFTFPSKIKNQLYTKFKNKRTLPSILNCETTDYQVTVSEPITPIFQNNNNV